MADHDAHDHTGVPGVTSGGYTPGGTDVPVTDGGTGASTASGARTNLGALADTDAITYLDGTVGSAPSTPASGKLRIYAKTGKVLAVKDDAGAETILGQGISDQGTVANYIDYTEVSAPSTPASGKVRLYAKSDGLLYSKDDAGAETAVSGGGSGGGSQPIIVQPFKQYTKDAQNTASFSKTITAVPTSRVLIVVVGSYNRDVNTPTCTNVTFTEIGAAAFVGSGTAISVFLGIPSATSGTTLAITATGSNWIIADVYELYDVLAGTAVASATNTDTSAGAPSSTIVGPIASAIGKFYVAAIAQNDGTTGFTALNLGTAADNLKTIIAAGSNAGMISAIGRVPCDQFAVQSWSGGSGGADMAAVLTAIS